MALDKQGRYSHLGKNGIKGPGNCTLGSLNDGDNVGVTFKFTATYQGHDVEALLPTEFGNSLIFQLQQLALLQ